MFSCGALTSGAVFFAGNTHNGVNNKYIETKDLDGVAGQSFSVCMDVKKAEDGTLQYLFSMGQGTSRGGLLGRFISVNKVRFGLYDDDTDTTESVGSATERGSSARALAVLLSGRVQRLSNSHRLTSEPNNVRR